MIDIDIDIDIQHRNGPKVFCEGFGTLKVTSETLRESNIWYWTSMVVYSSTRKPASRSCYELIRGSGQLWLYSRRVAECARVHVSLQNRNTREPWYLATCIWCHSPIGSHIKNGYQPLYFARACGNSMQVAKEVCISFSCSKVL